MNSNSSFNTSFSPAKSGTMESTKPHNPSNRSITDFENFEALRIAFENATTFSEQQDFSHIIPLTYDAVNQCYKLQPNSEIIFNYIVKELNKPKKPIIIDITKSKLYQKRFGNDSKYCSSTTNL
jgi:hypothetical protein